MYCTKLILEDSAISQKKHKESQFSKSYNVFRLKIAQLVGLLPQTPQVILLCLPVNFSSNIDFLSCYFVLFPTIPLYM